MCTKFRQPNQSNKAVTDNSLNFPSFLLLVFTNGRVRKEGDSGGGRPGKSVLLLLQASRFLALLALTSFIRTLVQVLIYIFMAGWESSIIKFFVNCLPNCDWFPPIGQAIITLHRPKQLQAYWNNSWIYDHVYLNQFVKNFLHYLVRDTPECTRKSAGFWRSCSSGWPQTWCCSRLRPPPPYSSEEWK